MAHDVFISYATADKSTADAVCARLEQNGIRCWIAPRDILPSAPWKPSIVAAIHASRALVLIFSTHANESTEVPKEVDQAVKKGVSIVAFRIEDVPPASGLDYELHGRHWLDALNPPLERHIDQLTVTLNALLEKTRGAGSQGPIAGFPPMARSTGSGGSRNVVLVSMVVLAVLVAGAIGWFVATATRSSPVESRVNAPSQNDVVSSTSPDSGRMGDDGSAQSTVATPAPAPQRERTPEKATPVSATQSAPPSAGPQRLPTTDRRVDTLPVDSTAPQPSQPSGPISKPDSDSFKQAASLVGCWAIPGLPGQIVVSQSHSFTSGGTITGQWSEAGDNVFLLLFPDSPGQAELSRDGRRLALTGPGTFTLVRPTAGSGILGEWRAEDGNPMPMTFGADGSFQMGGVRGKWHAAGGTQLFVMIWPGNRFSTVIHPDNQSLTMSDPAYGWTKDLKRVSCGPGSGR